MRLTWPLTGRAGEMRLIESALSDADTAGIVICGAAGLGKSRLAAEALDVAVSRNWVTHRVVGTSSARGLPLGAFASWAEPVGSDALQLVCRVIESVTACTDTQQVVVGVDDVHLLDDLSTFVLQQVTQRRAAKLVLTLRDGETVPDGIAELWKLDHFQWLDLKPLSPDESATLLSTSLAGSFDPETAGHLYRLTQGNVLYLRHIVEREVADGRLELRNGLWHWRGEPCVPRSLMELIDARIGALPADVGTVIDVLAVGEPLELSALQHIADPKSVEDADIRGLITVEQRGDAMDVRVAHPLYGEVRRNRIAPTRLRRLRGLVATELGESTDRDDVRILVRRAALSLDSDLPPDGDLLLSAARGAICLADLPLANRLAEKASHVVDGPEAQFIRAHALSWLGDGAAAEEVLAGVAAEELSDDEFARFTYFRASNMLWALAEPTRAKTIIDAAGHLTVDSARRCIDAVRAVYWFAVDRPDESLANAVKLSLTDLPAVIGAEVAWVLANIYGDTGRTTEAEDVAEMGYSIVRSSDAPQMRFNIADAHVDALRLSGRIDDALDLAARQRRQAADLPGAAHVLGIAIAGRAALGAGCLDEARELLQQAAVAFSASGHAIGWGYRYRLSHALVLAMTGSASQAAELLAFLDRLNRPFRASSYEKRMVRAWVAAGQGAVSEAIALLRSAAESAAAQGRGAAEVMCLQTAVQFGDRSCGPRLHELASVVEGPRVGLAARFASALHDGDAVALAAVSEAFDTAGDRIAAADAAAHAAIAYRRNDLRGSALSCAARAETLAAQCGHAQTPALREACSPLPLTDREREVALLVGQGLQNRDIAAALVVSVRTVEGHIYKAMTKTGMSSREELGRLLRPPDPPEPPTRTS